MFSLIQAWINGWANNRATGDVSRHRTPHDVALMARERNVETYEAHVHHDTPMQQLELNMKLISMMAVIFKNLLWSEYA